MFGLKKAAAPAAKPFWSSVTLQGLAAAAQGILGTIFQSAGALAPFAVLFGLSPQTMSTVNATLAVAGLLWSLWGRVRPGSGAPLSIGTSEDAALQKVLGPQRAAALEQLLELAQVDQGGLAALVKKLQEILPPPPAVPGA